MLCMTKWTLPLAHCQPVSCFHMIKCRILLTAFTADTAGILRCYDNQLFAVPLALVLKHLSEHSPACIGYIVSELVIAHEVLGFQILNGNDIIMLNQPSSNFLQVIIEYIGYFYLILALSLTELLPILKIILFNLGFFMLMVETCYSFFNSTAVAVEAALYLVLLFLKSKGIGYAPAVDIAGDQPFLA